MKVDAARAARNNAAWCDAVCSAHGCAGELSATHWLARAAAPPLHPNLVTLDGAVGPALDAVAQLAERAPSRSWAVKDSFAVLPLDRAGFELLFEAEWIVRPAPAGRARRSERWIRVEAEPALEAWEAAWGESAGRPRIFLPALLRREEIAILAALDAAGGIAGGVVANRSENAVGLTNFFARAERPGLRAESLEAASAVFPGLPLLGYESGAALEESEALGFRRLGALRVWQAGRDG